eukprot:TRINITY_DN76463_c0_g1_i1.p1 TRINITY_DN76463_c0_g1~~TRINITY_DN76463_c0_g1_i1.p1  ORF type:complete len:136 (+),score=18.39 TRINITY_DN76463_c0_g1_i1:45-452(+)
MSRCSETDCACCYDGLCCPQVAYQSPTASPSSGGSTVATVLGIIFGIVFLALFALLLYFFRRNVVRNNRRGTPDNRREFVAMGVPLVADHNLPAPPQPLVYTLVPRQVLVRQQEDTFDYSPFAARPPVRLMPPRG